ELALVDGSTAPYVPDLALVLVSSGDLQGAESTLANDIGEQVQRGSAAPDLRGELSLWATRLGTGADYACEMEPAGPLLDTLDGAHFPTPTASCPSHDQGHD